MKRSRRRSWAGILALSVIATAVPSAGVALGAQASRRAAETLFGIASVAEFTEFGTRGPFIRIPGTGQNIWAVSGAGIQGELHVVLCDNTGAIFHTVRRTNGSWQPLVNIAAVAGDGGDVIAVSAANVNDQLHVLMATEAGAIFHTIRSSTGSWQPIGNVAAVAGDPGDVIDVSGAQVAGELHVVMATDNGAVFHTIRRSDGNWQRIGNVGGQAGDPGDVRAVAAAGSGTELFVQEVAETGLSTVFTIRRADGTWTPIQEIRGMVTNQSRLMAPGAVGVRGEHHLFHIGEIPRLASPPDGELIHNVRGADGTWRKQEQTFLAGPRRPFSVGAAKTGKDLNLLLVSAS